MEGRHAGARSPRLVEGAQAAPRLRSSLPRRVAPAVAMLVAALGALGSVAKANHSLLEHISGGEINGNGAFGTQFLGASADGTRVFFDTPEQLVPADEDAVVDLYERSGGTTTLVSAGQINGNGFHGLGFEGNSDDGRRVFFSSGEQLVPGDADNSLDIYGRSGGTTRLLSAGGNGNGAFDPLFRGASADGTHVLFITTEQLVPADEDAVFDLYERSGGTTTLVSAGQINGNGPFGVESHGRSADGTRVFFDTEEQLVAADTDGVMDTYQRSAGTTRRISAGQINGNGAFHANFADASVDGSVVFFITTEQLVLGDTDNRPDIYRRSSGATVLVSRGQINGNGPFQARLTHGDSVSPDGTRVFFNTQEQLVAADTDASRDIYERSGGTTTLISAGQINGNGDSRPTFQGASDDGTRVFFDTEEQLVTADTDASRDIYERSGGTTKLISVDQINGNRSQRAFFRDASADGSRVFFETEARLVPGDDDQEGDVYERFAGTTTKVSPGSGAFGAGFRGASEDGLAVFFATSEQLATSDTDDQSDVYGAYVAP